MGKEKIYMICYHNDYHKRGMIANIVGMKKVSTKICYHIVFEDDEQDYIDINDIKDNDWHFVTLAELLRVGMPK
jgi:hypothetical protein